LPFFVFGVSRVFLPCLGLSRGLACRGRSYLFICLAWRAWLSRSVKDRARVFASSVSRIGRGLPVGVVGLFVCVIAWQALTLSRCVCFGASICRGFGLPLSVAGFRPFEQIFEKTRKVVRTNVRNKCSTDF